MIYALLFGHDIRGDHVMGLSYFDIYIFFPFFLSSLMAFKELQAPQAMAACILSELLVLWFQLCVQHHLYSFSTWMLSTIFGIFVDS